jgi:predicted DNA-binding transcriptional regulator AlpA
MFMLLTLAASWCSMKVSDDPRPDSRTQETPVSVIDSIPAGRLTYRINELAAMLGVSVKTLDRMRQNGTFPRPDQTAGRVLLWKKTTIEKWLDGEWKAKKSASGSKSERVNAASTV